MSKATIMLAKVAAPKLIDTKSWYSVSEKLDGQPAVIKYNSDKRKLEALTRQGKEVTSIDHILESLGNQVSDISHDIGGYSEIVGELYIPGMGSAEISGKARKHEPSPDLKLYVFPEFQDMLCRTDHVKFIQHRRIHGEDLLEYLFNNSTGIKVDPFLHDLMSPYVLNTAGTDEFEGYIARKWKDNWTPGKRSNNYLKIIEDPTIDLRVLDVEEAVSKEGVPHGRVGAFICEWDGGTCKVGAGKLSHKEAKGLWQNRLANLNKIIEVKYKRDAKYTLPRQPTFQRFRYDKDEYETRFPNG